MTRTPIFIALAMLALVTLACGVTINLPVDKISAGPLQTEKIEVPLQDSPEVDLTLAFGAGNLEIDPGAENTLVSGTASYNVEDFKPKITIDEQRVKVETGELDIKGIPNVDRNIKNEWDLTLGNTPMNLVISAGAYQGEIELGGLSLKSLEVNDGAATVDISFSEPNPVEMESLRYGTGASTVNMFKLANANFKSMIFRSGAGDYSLDFGGLLQQDAVVTIETGMSHVAISVPEGTPANVFFKGGLTNVTISGDWVKSGDNYSKSGSGSSLTINVDMGAGSLELRID